MKTSIKTTLTLFLSLLIVSLMPAQTKKGKEVKPEHKIIYQLTSGDTTVHKQLIKQFNNILTISPTTKIEVVCQGGGLDILVSGKTIVEDKMNALIDKGVVFNACEFAMKERKIDRASILPKAGTVPAGVIEIVSKQEQGWSYIKVN